MTIQNAQVAMALMIASHVEMAESGEFGPVAAEDQIILDALRAVVEQIATQYKGMSPVGHALLFPPGQTQPIELTGTIEELTRQADEIMTAHNVERIAEGKPPIKTIVLSVRRQEPS